MSLAKYESKRNFSITTEPSGKRAKPSKKKIFVIQKHAASHLHYDFRLEDHGVLVSWAIPKGPSLDPAEKRLAVHVEDHPLSYANFEGIIPKGQYGGGTVLIWDKGTYEVIGDFKKSYDEGKISFILHGEKLKGEWHLIRLKKNNKQEAWLLLKSVDKFCKKMNDYDILSKMPLRVVSGEDLEEIAQDPEHKIHNENDSQKKILELLYKINDIKTVLRVPTLSPQLATLVTKAPLGDHWLHETKYDGYRLLTYFRDGQVSLLTRNGLDWSHKFPSIVEALQKINLEGTVLDGEIVALNEKNTISFQSLQNALEENKPAKLIYYVFDLPLCLNYDLREQPLLERKSILEAICSEIKDNNIQYSQHIVGYGDEVIDAACKLDMEGIVSKNIKSSYHEKRTRDWLKIKCSKQQEFLIVGYSLSQKNREFASLLLGYYQNKQLYYCGHVGTGFAQQTLLRLKTKLQPLISEKPQIKNVPTDLSLKNTVWVKPQLIAEIKFLEWTEEGLLRHPSFLGLREDKSPLKVIKELPENSKEIEKDKLTHPEKILFLEKNFTKKDLYNYYQQVQKWILPFLVDRPLMILRCPESEKPCFFQKHSLHEVNDDIHFFAIQSKNTSKDYFYIQDERGLMALIQMNTIEIHPWGATINALEKPDQLTFDLDPDVNLSWKTVTNAAYRLRDLLQEYQLESFVKTSGKKGIHVVVPLTPKANWDEVKVFAKLIADAMVKKFPNEYVATMSKSKRQGKVFIDYFRNNRGSTTIAAYSCRATAQAGVSMPVAWTQLSSLSGADHYDIKSAVARLKRISKDPWEGFWEIRQGLEKYKS